MVTSFRDIFRATEKWPARGVRVIIRPQHAYIITKIQRDAGVLCVQCTVATTAATDARASFACAQKQEGARVRDVMGGTERTRQRKRPRTQVEHADLKQRSPERTMQLSQARNKGLTNQEDAANFDKRANTYRGG